MAKPQGLAYVGCWMVGGGWLGFATIQRPQPCLAGTWAELGNTQDSLHWCQTTLICLMS